MRDYAIHCLSEAVSPIRHASGTVGNEMVIATEVITTPKGPRRVPFISGNALRHRCIREPGVLWLVNLWDLGGKLTKQQLNFLLHGGGLTESTAFENTKRIAEFNRLFPLLKCLGGCLPGQILKGSMTVDRGMLVCEENRELLSRALPAGVALDSRRLLSSEAMTSAWQHTRGDSGKSGLTVATDEREQGTLMIFSGQQVNPGSVFYHAFHLNHVTDLEYGAALLSLRLWQSQGGTIGGHAARGAGRLDTEILQGDSQDDAVSAYVQHAEQKKDECIGWLHEQFKPVVDKAAVKKPAKGKKVEVAAVTEVGGLFGEGVQ